MLKGLPASGKSEFAKSQVAKRNGKVKRINRDDLRNMLDNGIWSKNNEKLIKQCEEHLAILYLHNGHDIIIDNTHLSPKSEESWKQFADMHKAKFEIVDFTDVPLIECIKRDQKRPNYVGEKVIKRMHNQFLAKPPANPPITGNFQRCWCFDLDGTLALHRDRSPYDTAKCEDDIVNESVRAILNHIPQPRNIFLVSGRSDEFRPHTERWLRANEIEYTALYMRPTGDLREDGIIKREIYEAHIKDNFIVMGWFDDRLRVCREIHNLGLPLFRVGDPESDF